MEEHPETLAALVEILIPSGDGPGAVESAASDYVEKMLVQPAIQPVRRRICRLLSDLNAAAVQGHGQDFHNLDLSHRDRLFADAVAEGGPGSQEHRTAAAYLVWLSVEGFLCHPRQGGNRGYAGWLYLGLRVPEVGAG